MMTMMMPTIIVVVQWLYDKMITVIALKRATKLALNKGPCDFRGSPMRKKGASPPTTAD
jgi:hypothetical protein